MSTLNLTDLRVGAERAEDWIKNFNPNKRVLTGRSYLAAKRALDLLLVLGSSPIWLPVMALTALLIWITDSRPILFTQFRSG